MKDGMRPNCGSYQVYESTSDLDQRSRRVLAMFSHVRLEELICRNCGLVQNRLADMKDVKRVRAQCTKVRAIRKGISPQRRHAGRRQDGHADRGQAAIVAGAEERGARPESAEAFEARTGKGVVGEVGGRRVALGNAALLTELGLDAGALAAQADELRRTGQTAMFVAIDGRVAGLLGVADPIKATTAEAIAQLHAEGLRVVMLTGDAPGTANAVAAQLGLDDVVAEVLPGQKVEVVKRLQAEGRIVAMAATA